MDKNTNKQLLNYCFFILQFLTVIVLIRAGKLDNVKEVIFIITLFAVYLLVETKLNLFISNYIRGCVIILTLLHAFAGKYLDFYLTSTIFDKVLHVFGTYSIVLLVYSIMCQIMETSFTNILNKYVFIVLLGISLGAIFEIIEFVTDNTIHPKIPNQPNLIDTDLDMIADVIGSKIAALHVCFGSVLTRLSSSNK